MSPSFASLGDMDALRNVCSYHSCPVSSINLAEQGSHKLARIPLFAFLFKRELNPLYVLFCLLFFLFFICRCFGTGMLRRNLSADEQNTVFNLINFK